MYLTVSVHVGQVRTYYLSGGTVFRGDNLGSGKCIFYGGGGVLSHWGELTYGEIRYCCNQQQNC